VFLARCVRHLSCMAALSGRKREETGGLLDPANCGNAEARSDFSAKAQTTGRIKPYGFRTQGHDGDRERGKPGAHSRDHVFVIQSGGASSRWRRDWLIARKRGWSEGSSIRGESTRWRWRRHQHPPDCRTTASSHLRESVTYFIVKIEEPTLGSTRVRHIRLFSDTVGVFLDLGSRKVTLPAEKGVHRVPSRGAPQRFVKTRLRRHRASITAPVSQTRSTSMDRLGSAT